MLRYINIQDIVDNDNNKIFNPPASDDFYSCLSINMAIESDYAKLKDFLHNVLDIGSDIKEVAALKSNPMSNYHLHALDAIITVSMKNLDSGYLHNPALIQLAADVAQQVSESLLVDGEVASDLFSSIVVYCDEEGILNEKTLNNIFNIKTMYVLAKLNEIDFLTEKAVRYVVNHKHPDKLYACIEGIDGFYQGDEDQRENLSTLLLSLSSNGLDCTRFFEITELANSQWIISLIENLQYNELLSQDIFDQLLEYAHIFSALNVPAWLRFGALDVGNQPFNVVELLGIAKEAGNEKNASVKVNERLGQLLPEESKVDEDQIVHTPSIHASVSLTLLNLKEIFKDQFETEKKLEIIFNQIHDWLDKLEETTNISDKVVAAKKALAQIKSSSFVDPRSNVSLPQVVALAWLLVNQPDYQKTVRSMEKDNDENYKKQVYMPLLQALYECQRIGNIHRKTGVDNEKPDVVSCPPGQINIIIVNMKSVHPAVKVDIITHEDVQERLYVIVIEEVNKYLQSISPTKLREHIKLLDETPEDEDEFEPNASDKSLWTKIRSSILKRMRDEGLDLAYDGDTARLEKMVDDGLFYLAGKRHEVLSPFKKHLTPLRPNNRLVETPKAPTKPLNAPGRLGQFPSPRPSPHSQKLLSAAAAVNNENVPVFQINMNNH